MKYTSIGGQAVMEGVMMRSQTSLVMSVRRADGTIVVDKQTLSQKPWRKTVAKIPIVRGVVAFVDSLIQGMNLTSKSAEMYGEDALAGEEPTKFEKWLSKTFNLKIETVAIVLGIILGLGLSFALFIFLPSLASRLFWHIFSFYGVTAANATVEIKLLLNVIEGVIKILIFLGYLLGVGCMKDIKRVFMYHGAEHKVISCFEHGDELTVENARKYSTSHPRCGTSFLFIIMILGILVSSVADNLFGLSNANTAAMVTRIGVKLLLLPVIAGLSYEILKLLAKSDNVVFRILRAPGMLLQKLSTREPDDSMLEVSLTSFKSVLVMDGLMTEEDAKLTDDVILTCPLTDTQCKKEEKAE
ncbi:MAG: DUF1385 domain-containing protein [Clostridia bacterium]|nr:DUF1385 domain-containing protein [Clostridia bacterium]